MGKFDNATAGINLFSQLKNAEPDRTKREAQAAEKEAAVTESAEQEKETSPKNAKPADKKNAPAEPKPATKGKTGKTAGGRTSPVPNIRLTVEKNRLVPHTVRLEEELYNKIQGIAKINGISINKTIQILLEQAIELLDSK